MQGLRSVNHQGAFKAAAYLPDGTFVLLFDQGDGLRLLKTNAAATTVLAQVQRGASGDTGIALATDAQGNIYVGGTSSSGALEGTTGVVFPQPVDSSTNSFLAKFDKDLNPVFLTFLGADRTALSAISVTGDAVFAAGLTFSPYLPTTAAALQRSPPLSSEGNGFVERFSLDGSTLGYATYLGGNGGSTSIASMAADATDNAYVVGSTTSTAFPLANPLQSTFFGDTSGFAAKLAPSGHALQFATLIAGSGLSSVALDPATGGLLLTGELALGDFPVSNVTTPLAAMAYQSVLRLSADGQTLQDATVLFPGTESAVTAGPNGTAWLSGALSAPLGELERHLGAGDSYALQLGTDDTIATALRLGGNVVNNSGYASLHSTVGAPALNAAASSLILPATLMAHADPASRSAQRFDVSLSGGTNAVLTSVPGDVLPASCSSGSPCDGTAGLLTLLSSAPGHTSLSISTGDAPVLSFRNSGTVAAAGVAVTASGFTVNTNCSSILQAGQQCAALLSGSGPGSVTITAANTGPITASFPSLSEASTFQPLAFNIRELDFGIVTSAAAESLGITVSNLGTTAQTFASGPEGVPTSASYSLSETASTCSGPPTAHTVPAQTSCTVTISLSVASNPGQDGLVQAAWRFGSRDLKVSGFAQASMLGVSADVIDFGLQLPAPAPSLPRFLYLSNPSPLPASHTPLYLSSSSPFQINDDCPTTLEPRSVCQIGLTYMQSSTPALDTVTLSLEQGLSVLVKGQTVSSVPASSALLPSPLLISAADLAFATPVNVSELSDEVKSLQVTNQAAVPLQLNTTVLGDYQLQNGCSSPLDPGHSCTLTITFAPSNVGTREGILTISPGASYQPSTVALSGTGRTLLGDDLESVDFGSTSVGEPVTRWLHLGVITPQLTVTAVGGSMKVAVLADFGGGHGTLPTSAFTEQTQTHCIYCWIAVQFLPATVGTVSGTLQVASDSAARAQQIALSGTGLPVEGLLLTPAVTDLGNVPVGSTSAPFTFTLTNALANAQDVEIQNISVAGDVALVTDTTLPACKGTLFATAACGIQLMFQPSGKGSRSGELTVLTSEGTVSAAISGTGTTDPGLALRPDALSFGSASEQQLTLLNTGDQPVQITSVATIGSVFQASADNCKTLQPGASCVVKVSCTSVATAQTSTLTIVVSRPDVSGQSTPTSYSVPLSINSTGVSAPLAIFPTHADFGPVTTGSLGQLRQFSLTNTTKSMLRVELAASRHFPLATLAACAALEPGATCDFSAIFLPQSGGPLSGTIVASAKASDGSLLAQASVDLEGYGVASGVLSASGGTDPESPLNFGQIPSGGTGSLQLTVTNTGLSTVNLRRVNTTAPFHADASCAGELAPNSACTLPLIYTPTFNLLAGSAQPPRTDTGTITIESEAEASPQTIYLSGIAVPAVTDPATSASLPVYALSQTAVAFANTAPGTTSVAQTLNLINTGTAILSIGHLQASDDFTADSDCLSLQPGAACAIQVTFQPAAGDKPSIREGTLAIQSNGSNALELVTLFGSAVQAPLVADPEELTFGAVALGSTVQRTSTLTNGTLLPMAFGPFAFVGDYSRTGGTCPASGGSLAAGQSCTLIISFAPVSEGTRNGSLSLDLPGATQPVLLSFTGTGLAGHVQASPQALDFGTVDLNTSATQSIQLTNTGTANLTGIATRLTGVNAAEFQVSSPECSRSPLPPGAACNISVDFAPQTIGSHSASLLIASSDPASPTVIALSGIGAEPPGFTLTVNGGSSATATLASGAVATFPLLLTGERGYALPVHMVCTPVVAAPNSLCVLDKADLSLSAGPVAAIASVNTSDGLTTAAAMPGLLLLLAPASAARSGKRRWRMIFVGTAGIAFCLIGLGCGGGYAGVNSATLTPPGTYVYRVTASATQGTPVSSSVTLSITVH